MKLSEAYSEINRLLEETSEQRTSFYNAALEVKRDMTIIRDILQSFYWTYSDIRNPSAVFSTQGDIVLSGIILQFKLESKKIVKNKILDNYEQMF